VGAREVYPSGEVCNSNDSEGKNEGLAREVIISM
jgi:hypothetical protein